MAMTKVTGTEFETQMPKNDRTIAQSVSKKSSGQIRVYKDEDGNLASAYKIDAGSKQFTFEGLLEASAAVPKKGEPIRVDGVSCYIESAEVIYKNDDVQKLRITANHYADLA